MLINRDNAKFRIGIFFFIFGSFIFAQETHNLEIIWVKTASPEVRYLGGRLSSGDFNGDSFADIVINGDSLHGDTWTHKAYIFFGGPQFDTIPDIVIVKGFIRLKGIGDINDDGFDDLALGSPNSPFGRVYIYLGGNPMDTICDFELKGPQDASEFGEDIGSGDVNGDSFSDLIVGAYGYDNLKGRVYIYFGGPNFDTIPDVILEGGHQGDYEGFGTSVGGNGDVNSDGYQDIIIGAANFGTSYNGRIYIYFGGDPPDPVADVAMIGEGPNQQLGWAKVDFLKNLNDFDYASASTSLWPRGVGYNPGKIYVLFGGNSMDSIPDIWMIGKQDSSALGTSTSSAGDLTQDFNDELISGAPIEYDYKGTTYLWLGGTILDTIPDAWIRGMEHNDGIGWHVASAGDVNCDGKDEIIVSNSATIQMPKRVWICKYTGAGIGEERRTLDAIRLMPEIYPNPSRTHSAIRFLLNARSKVSLKAYDITGKIVRTLNNELTIFEPGNYEIKWDLRDDCRKRVATGIYFIEINTEKELREIRKITVVK